MHDINSDNANLAYGALVNAGFPANIIPYVLAQAAYESLNVHTNKAFDSNIALTDNNFSGIKYNAKYNGNIASLGTQSDSSDGSHYAHYQTPTQWGLDMKRIVSLDRGFGKPIDASSLADYVHRLKGNGRIRPYFEDTEERYLAGINSLYNTVAFNMPFIFTTGAIAQASNDLIDTITFNQEPVNDTPNPNTGIASEPDTQNNKKIIGTVAAIVLGSVITYFLFT